MDYKSVHSKFLHDIHKFMELIKITPFLMTLLESHPCSHLMPSIKAMTIVETQKYAILSQFTQSRDACDRLIEFLDKDDQKEVATLLRQYNKTTKRDSYINEIKLDIKKANEIRSGHSRWFVMDGAPRGRVLLFLQIPSLENEAKRFDIMFQELYFKVDIMRNLNGQGIRDKCQEVAKKTFPGDALILMYIGHGHDEMISPSAPETADPNTVADPSDDIHIKLLVDIFAETTCHPTLRNKPKVFVFNCCRIKIPTKSITPAIEKDWIDSTTRTFICYACAEGTTAFYYPNGFTIFGQVFSHTIADYAYEMSLTQIFNKTCNELGQWVIGGDELDEKQRPQLTMKHVDRELFLNPGLFNPNKR